MSISAKSSFGYRDKVLNKDQSVPCDLGAAWRKSSFYIYLISYCSWGIPSISRTVWLCLLCCLVYVTDRGSRDGQQQLWLWGHWVQAVSRAYWAACLECRGKPGLARLSAVAHLVKMPQMWLDHKKGKMVCWKTCGARGLVLLNQIERWKSSGDRWRALKWLKLVVECIGRNCGKRQLKKTHTGPKRHKSRGMSGCELMDLFIYLCAFSG